MNYYGITGGGEIELPRQDGSVDENNKAGDVVSLATLLRCFDQILGDFLRVVGGHHDLKDR